jgi:hypothetical protein
MIIRVRVLISALLVASGIATAQNWRPLLNGKDLTGWEVIHDGLWHVTKDGILVGQRDAQKKNTTNPNQSWVYTTREFGEYDLEFEYWLRFRDNSGVSIRDKTRARYSGGAEADPKRTPSHNGYEIQIINGHTDKYPTGSLYLFQPAKTGAQQPWDWNTMRIEVRNDVIRVRLNGQLVMEHPGDPERPKTGPIGLQLHDAHTVVMFRNIRIREIATK